MIMPDGVWYYGWAGSPPYPVTLNPGDTIPDDVAITLTPGSGLFQACAVADAAALSDALITAMAPVSVQAVAVVAVAVQAAAVARATLAAAGGEVS